VYLEDRLKAGVWNAQVLVRELRQRGYEGGWAILKDWLQPQRAAEMATAVRRFETPPGKQAQVDWGHLGYLDTGDEHRQVWGFAITLGYSRRMWAQAALDQKLGTLLRMHEAAFRDWGAIPEEILYDRMKTVWPGSDERAEIVWHPVFLDFARYWGFRPRLCRPYLAQTKGQDRVGREVRGAQLRLRTVGPGALVPDGFQHPAAAMGGRRRQPASGRDHAGTGLGALGHGSVQQAVAERPAPISLQR
jgi:transposase